MTAVVLDVALVLILVASAVHGYRRGFILTVSEAIGFLAGAALALAFLPSRLDALAPWMPSALRPAALMVVALVLGVLGQLVVVRLTRSLRQGTRRGPARGLDRGLGSLITLAVAALAVWFSAGLLRVAAPTSITATIGKSQVLGVIDTVIPGSSQRVLDQILIRLNDYGFPRVFNGLKAEPITPVAAGDPAVTRNQEVAGAKASILRVQATARQCQRRMEGTGWVAGEHLVVTNAHVVAGSESVTVRQGSDTLMARVVAFDPKRDLAVLSVADLSAPSLVKGTELAPGANAVVAGYPRGGPYRLDAARVRDVIQATGRDIYGSAQVQRRVYSLRAQIHPGNSGGPLLATDGSVAGVVFARSLDDATTAYALTLDEVRPVIDAGARGSISGRSVGTGECAA